MPIEIRELVIRATIDPGEAPQRGTGELEPQKDRTELVEECVGQVLDILRKRSER